MEQELADFNFGSVMARLNLRTGEKRMQRNLQVSMYNAFMFHTLKFSVTLR